MPERHGIERLRWLQENHEHASSGFGMSYRDFNPANAVAVPRYMTMHLSEVQIEIATALIEELHDALLEFKHPMVVLHDAFGGTPSHQTPPTPGSK